MHIDFYKHYENKYVFEGKQREQYNWLITKWRILSSFSILFPLIITFITDIYSNKLSFGNVINNADFVLLSFSLTIPTMLDLIETKRNTAKDSLLRTSEYGCLGIIITQVLFYALIRSHNNKFALNCLATIIIVVVSILLCRYSVFCIFMSTITKDDD